MIRTIYYILPLAFILLITIHAQTMERKDIPEKYKWNLQDVYKSIDDWKADYNKINSLIDEVEKYKGKLGENAETFNNALNSYFNLQKEFA